MGKASPDVIIPGEGKKPGSPVQADGVHYRPPGPIIKSFMLDDSFIVGIRGPFGSGKSTGCIMKLTKNMQTQRRAPDGWKYRRTAIIRNTYPELRTTTMKSWHQWVPQHKGRWREAGPPMHHIIDTKNKISWEVLFVALDRPDDVAKLLSMELSDAWINEAREVPKAIIDGLTGRVGRFPAVWQGGCDNAQILLDTNPPDTDHWWYVMAERDTSNERNRQIVESMLEAQEQLRRDGLLRPDQEIMRFYKQPSGRSPQAENIDNLRPGYYTLLMAGKDQDFIKVYVDGEYGFIMDGLPVYPEYKDSTHCRPTKYIPSLGLRIGMDFGLTPAATISQRKANGCWQVLDEYVSERLGIVTFAKGLTQFLAEKYPGAKIVASHGDPAGDAMTPEEKTCFQIMTAGGLPTEMAPTQDPVKRREGVAYLLRTMVDGEPAIIVDPRCTFLRKGLAGGFHRRRIQVTGDIKFRDVPEKNTFSHVCEALEYDVVSAGEHRNVTVMKEVLHAQQGRRQMFAMSDYEEF